MKCPNCEKTIPSGFLYCAYCGAHVSKPVSVAYVTTVNRFYSPTRNIVCSKTKATFPALLRLMFRYALIPTLFFLGSAVFLSGVILGILPFGSDRFFAFGLILLLLMVLSGAR